MQIVEPQLLIADDDQDFRETLREVLNRRGYRTILAEDGQGALEIAQKQPVHMMVLDLHMPRLDGLQTVTSLRNIPLLLPCILMSAELDAAAVHRAKSLNLAAILAKPFSISKLTRAVEETLFATYGWRV